MKTLYKYHSAFGATKAAPASPWALTPGSDFQLIPGTAGGLGFLYVYSDTYFDLAGMSQEDKTLFFEAIDVQTPSLPAWDGIPTAGDSLTLIDVMTSVPLNIDATLLTDVGNGVGFPLTRSNFEHVIYARSLQYVSHLDLGTFASPTLVASNNYGSGMPTASDRVYSYRFIFINTDNATNITSCLVPAARHILVARATEEPEYIHMMRLMRSYNLQQEPDVD